VFDRGNLSGTLSRKFVRQPSIAEEVHKTLKEMVPHQHVAATSSGTPSFYVFGNKAPSQGLSVNPSIGFRPNFMCNHCAWEKPVRERSRLISSVISLAYSRPGRNDFEPRCSDPKVDTGNLPRVPWKNGWRPRVSEKTSELRSQGALPKASQDWRLACIRLSALGGYMLG
jgi:hypothetical protein